MEWLEHWGHVFGRRSIKGLSSALFSLPSLHLNLLPDHTSWVPLFNHMLSTTRHQKMKAMAKWPWNGIFETVKLLARWNLSPSFKLITLSVLLHWLMESWLIVRVVLGPLFHSSRASREVHKNTKKVVPIQSRHRARTTLIHMGCHLYKGDTDSLGMQSVEYQRRSISQSL